MDGFLVCCSGLSADQKEGIYRSVKRMGGKYSGDLTAATTHLVCHSDAIQSAKYKVAHKMDIPCLMSEWVEDSLVAYQQDPRFRAESIQERYLVKPLCGLRICGTGLYEEQRREIQRLAEELGGTYEKNLSKECTHLIATNTQSKKYEYAVLWKIHLVSVDWIYECKKRKERISEEEYPVRDSETPPITVAVVDQNCLSATNLSGDGAEDHAAAELSSIIRKGSVTKYFSGYTICLSAAFAEDRRDFLRLCTIRGGGQISTELTGIVTHYVTEEGFPDKSAVQQADRMDIPSVNWNWIRDCARISARLPVDDYLTAKPSQPRPPPPSIGAKLAPTRTLPPVDEIQSKQQQPLKLRKQPAKKPSIQDFLPPVAASKPPNKPLHNASALPEPAVMATLLEPPKMRVSLHSQMDESSNMSAIWETSSLLKGFQFECRGFIETQIHILQRVIRAHGGKTVDNLPPGRPGFHRKCCVIVPFSNRDIRQSQSEREEDDSFVTDLWLERCLADRALHEPCSSAVFQPLLVDLNISEFRGYCITVTGFEGLDRDNISTLIKHLGATYTENLTRKNTHVIYAIESTGKKCEKAKEWGIQVVPREWLEAKARAQRRLASPINASSRDNSSPKHISTTIVAADTNLSPACKTPLMDKSISGRRESLDGSPLETSLARNLKNAVKSYAGNTSDPSTILQGVVICISAKLTHRRTELRNAAVSLGAQFLGEGFQDLCTHYLHFSNSANETFKDFKVAKRKKKLIVSPRWLLDCLQHNRRLNESDYPHTLQPSKAPSLPRAAVRDVRPTSDASSQRPTQPLTFSGLVPKSKPDDIEPLSSWSTHAPADNPKRTAATGSTTVPDKIATQSKSSFSALINQFISESSKENAAGSVSRPTGFAGDDRKEAATALSESVKVAPAVSIKSSGNSTLPSQRSGGSSAGVVKSTMQVGRKRKETLKDLRNSKDEDANQHVVYDDPDSRAAKRQMISKLSTAGE